MEVGGRGLRLRDWSKQNSTRKMGLTAMVVGGAFGVGAKASMNNLMKISMRRGGSNADVKHMAAIVCRVL